MMRERSAASTSIWQGSTVGLFESRMPSSSSGGVGRADRQLAHRQGRRGIPVHDRRTWLGTAGVVPVYPREASAFCSLPMAATRTTTSSRRAGRDGVSILQNPGVEDLIHSVLPDAQVLALDSQANVIQAISAGPADAAAVDQSTVRWLNVQQSGASLTRVWLPAADLLGSCQAGRRSLDPLPRPGTPRR